MMRIKHKMILDSPHGYYPTEVPGELRSYIHSEQPHLKNRNQTNNQTYKQLSILMHA